MRKKNERYEERMVYGNSEITLDINCKLLLFDSAMWSDQRVHYSYNSFLCPLKAVFLFYNSPWLPLKKVLQNLYFICNIVQLSKTASLL